MHPQVALRNKFNSFFLRPKYIPFVLFPYVQEGVPLLHFDLIFQPLEYFDCGQHRDRYIVVDNYK